MLFSLALIIVHICIVFVIQWCLKMQWPVVL